MAAESNLDNLIFICIHLKSTRSNAGSTKSVFPLHALGAITSGDQTPADGTLTTVNVTYEL